MAFKEILDTFEKKKAHVLEMGGKEKINRQHSKGKYTARERIARLLDPDTFFEIGRFSHSDMPGMEDKTPADSKIVGYGKIFGRRVAVSANDFTVMAATSSRVAGRKESEVKNYASQKGMPVIYLGEAGGARMPDIMGSKGLASLGGGVFDGYLKMLTRVRKTPLVTAILGECYGMPTWVACLSDFVVQVEGSAMGVSGPRVLEIALGEKITDEELGGCKVHSEITGNIDKIAKNEDHCFDIIKQYLSYLPSHNNELPPVYTVPNGSGDAMEKILDFLPEKRNRTYDMLNILRCIVDADSLFEIKPDFGKAVITAFARINGKSVGIIASQPMFMAGAMDTNGIDKVTSFLCLADSFNIPLLFFHDTPGFLVGKEAERNRVGAKVMNFLNALGLVTVPKISIIVRKTYGMAFYNMCGPGCGADFIAAWPTAEMSFVDPAVAVNVVSGSKHLDPDEKKSLFQSMVDDASPFGAAGMFYIHDVIEPKQTRTYLINALEIATETAEKGIGEHKLANWPTKF